MKNLPPENPIEALVEYTERYSQTTAELLKLQLLEQSTSVSTWFMTRLLVAGMYFFFAAIGSAGIALWAGDLLGNAYLGFFMVAAAYLLAGVVFQTYLYRWIKKPVSDALIRQILP